MQVKASQAVEIITALIQAKLVPMVYGQPGIGKSAISHQIAKTYNLKVIDYRLSQCDPTDLLGLPHFSDGKVRYAPFETFPIESEPIPDGYAGWLLLLDEFTSASVEVQAAAYKIVLDRMVGQEHLHKNVAIICLGNREEDNAIVNTMSTALQSRLVHMELQADTEEWCNWAMANNIDHRITDYIKFKPNMLNTFNPAHTDHTYACPRTWEFTNRVIKHMDNKQIFTPMLSGILSEGVAREFITYCRIYDSLPKPGEIEKNPDTVPVPTEPSVLYAISGSLANTATMDNFTKLMQFIKRMPEEFQVITLREVYRRKKEMLSHPAVQTWAKNASVTYF